MNKYPLGLIAKTDCFHVFSSVFTKECESFILSRMKASSKNVKPVIIVDDNTKECICKIPNNSLTTLTVANDTYAQILCVRVYQNADYMIQKFQIQKSNKTKEQKTKAVDKLLKKD